MRWDNLLYIIFFFFCLFVEHLHMQFYCFETIWSPLGGIVCCVEYLDVSTLFFCWANGVCGVT